MNILETKGLSYRYGDGTLALDGVDITIQKGSTTGIIGGNGSGKSTLFLNLNGVLKPAAGSIFLREKPVIYEKKALQELRAQVGIVFQNSDEQLFSANVKKDLAFGLRNLGFTAEETEERLASVIARTGIGEILEKPTHALSFGQKKRVAIAGVLAMQPSVVILDEPTAGLDPQGVSRILDLVEELKEDWGVTVVFSTHEIDLVPLYCDQVYLLDRGKVAFSGTPEELCGKPELLRAHHLRLPRISHLLEILKREDGISVDARAGTISKARAELRRAFLE